MKRILAAPLAICMTVAALAQGRGEHVSGTVAHVAGASIGVKTSTGKTTVILTNDRTMWRRGSSLIGPKDVRPGEPVNVTVRSGDTPIATMVQIPANATIRADR